MHSIQQWILRYIAQCINVSEKEAWQVWEKITKWINTQGGFAHDLSTYPLAILLPVGHILAMGWPGRDCIVGFSSLARSYGLSSLPYVRALMGGLDYEYMDILRRVGEGHKIPQQRFYALWLAAETAEDLLNEFSDDLQSATAEVNRTVKLANYLLGYESTLWRNEPFAPSVESALRAIARKYI
jgi:hypothetical protein